MSKQCCEFDGVWYLQQHPDVAADGKYNTPGKAYAHWLEIGQYVGYKPGPVCITTDDTPAPIDPGDGTGVPGPVVTANSGKGLLIAGAGLLIVFHKQIAKMFGIKL